MRAGILLLCVACGTKMLAPADVPNLKPGQSVRVHVWAPGTPGPGHVISGTFEKMDEANIFVRDSKGAIVEIHKGEIHDDTRNTW